MTELAALIVTLGTDLPRLHRAISAVLASETELTTEVVVVVNAAADPFVAAGIEAPDTVRVVVAGANLGWAGGLRTGRAATTARLLWLVQDDMEPDTACLDRLVAGLEAPASPAVVGPVVVRDAVRDAHGVIVDGIVPRDSCGGLLNPAVFGQPGLPWEKTVPILIDRHPAADTPLASLGHLPATDYIPSRGMMMAAATWDAAGGVDARFYPVGATDVDFCRALHAAGYSFALVAGARTTHEGSASTPRSMARAVFGRNRARVVEKWRDGDLAPRQLGVDVPSEVRDAVLIGATEAVAALVDELDRVASQRDALKARLDALKSRAETEGLRP